MVLLLAVGFFAVACGDSTENTDTTHEGHDHMDEGTSGTDATDDHGTDDHGTDDSTTDSGTGSDTGTDTGTDDTTTGPTDGGACTGDTDMAFLEAEQRDDGGQGYDVAVDAARDCGLTCLSAADSRECLIDCMIDEKGVDVSRDCAGCYGDTMTCTVQNCLAQCVVDSTSQECLDCQEEAGCVSAFYECTGLEEQETEPAAGDR